MCPDREILSLYYDRELPSPWKEKLELHLESCTSCREIMQGYKNLGILLKEEEKESRIISAMERVYEKLPQSRTDLISESVPDGLPDINIRRKSARKSFPVSLLWNRSVSLPMPIAAGALIIFLMTFIFGFYNSRAGLNNDINLNGSLTTPVAENPIQNPVQSLDSMAVVSDFLYDGSIFQDMNSIIQYFSTQDGSDIVIISLPENRRFYHAGEPVLINANDYSRGSGPR